jgi:predicted MPP superfamily phosphohydrolase
MGFRLIVVALFAAIDAYLSMSLRLGVPGIVLLSLGFVVVLWVPFVFWQSDREETTRFELAMQWLAFGFMGWVSLLWVATLLRDLLSLVWKPPLHAAELMLIASGAFLLGALNAFFGVRVREIPIAIDGLPPALEGLRIAHLSDVHVGPTIRKRTLSRIVRRVEGAKPDLLALTGDAVDGMVGELSPYLEPLRTLQPPLGKFYIPGNHEYYWAGADWIRKFEELGFRALANAHAVVAVKDARLLIAGVTDPAAAENGGEAPSLERALAGAQGFPKILLAHRPDFAPAAEKSGIQLQLSGHTHGGQFFPWTLVVKWVHRYAHGLHRLGGMWLYVSRGTGYWGPPVRLGAPPEVAILVLAKA